MNTSISQKIKALRQQKGYSQEYVADKIHISQSAYSAIERGESMLNVSRLVDLAKVYEIDPAELVIEEGKIINFNHDNSTANGFVNNYYNSDLKEANDKHFETLNKIDFICNNMYTFFCLLIINEL